MKRRWRKRVGASGNQSGSRSTERDTGAGTRCNTRARTRARTCTATALRAWNTRTRRTATLQRKQIKQHWRSQQRSGHTYTAGAPYIHTHLHIGLLQLADTLWECMHVMIALIYCALTSAVGISAAADALMHAIIAIIDTIISCMITTSRRMRHAVIGIGWGGCFVCPDGSSVGGSCEHLLRFVEVKEGRRIRCELRRSASNRFTCCAHAEVSDIVRESTVSNSRRLRSDSMSIGWRCNL